MTSYPRLKPIAWRSARAMKLHRPLHVCAYFFGVFPAIAVAEPRRRPRFRVHWPGLVLKAVHAVFYWLLSLLVFVVTMRNVKNYQKLTKQMLTTRVLDIEELYLYQIVSGILATMVCQAHMLWPSVVRALNECFFDLCYLDDIAGTWQIFSAFSAVLMVVLEFVMYIFMISTKLVPCTLTTHTSHLRDILIPIHHVVKSYLITVVLHVISDRTFCRSTPSGGTRNVRKILRVVVQYLPQIGPPCELSWGR